MKIGLVVGEVSGDNLGASLIKALKVHWPNVSVEGVIGPKLKAEGAKALGDMERLAVMGYFEPLARLPELYKLRQRLIQHFKYSPPDIFIGIDAPDFNLGIEQQLHDAGIPVVHYVSPSVWAWKRYRLKTIRTAVDLMLCLFPFEAKFYQDEQIRVSFVGHPMADEIPLNINTESAKKALGFLPTQRVVALLPGSRNSELKYLGLVFLETANLLWQKEPDLQFVAPLVSEKHKIVFQKMQQAIAPLLPLKILVNKARVSIAAAEAVLVTSGTATLEVMLHKKPMVVAYKMHPITYHLVRHFIKVPYIALPNLLAGKALVPECIQEKAQPEILGKLLSKMLHLGDEKEKLLKEFQDIHINLKQNASEKAALAIQSLLEKKGCLACSFNPE